MKIVLIGMKGSGKSTIGRRVAEKLKVNFFESDREIEKEYEERTGKKLSFREIMQSIGQEYFRKMETKILQELSKKLPEGYVLSCGGGTPLNQENQTILKSIGKIIYLDVAANVLLPRITANGIPAFFPYQDDPKKSLNELLEKRKPVYEKLADITIDCGTKNQEQIVNTIISQI